ncbi:MAG: hypothetical protein ACLRRT_10190 [Ruthenibacterium lactatiformans]
MEKKAEHGGWQEMLHGLFQKKNWLFFVGLAGICLIFLSDILFGGREGSTGAARQSTQQAVSAATGVQELETRLTEMLESVQGAGKVQVMIILKAPEKWCMHATNNLIHRRRRTDRRCDGPKIL